MSFVALLFSYQPRLNYMLRCILRRLPLGLAAFSAAALAHTGHEIGGFASGFAHPFGGLDHLLAMVAVGVWSTLQAAPNARQRFSWYVWLWPTVFVVTMLLGALAGLDGIHIPAVESSIALSVLALGLLIALRTRLPIGVGALLVAAFAVVHGHAHGSELPDGASVWPYLTGMACTTLLLHVSGVLAGVQLRRRNAWFVRVLGAAIAGAGIVLLT
jgi:urease accessory protein